MADELDYFKLAQKDLKRQNTNRFKKKLKEEVKRVIFPCSNDVLIEEETELLGSVESSVESYPVSDVGESDVTNENSAVIPHIEPSFPGGQGKMMDWIQKNTQYPQEAIDANQSGVVYVQFNVGRNGTILTPTIIQGVSTRLNKEAIRLVQSMPKWNPAMYNGSPVEATYTLPINFRLSE